MHVREVYLKCGDMPVVFAHSVAVPDHLRHPWRAVARLGVRRGSLTTSFTTRNRLMGNQTLNMRLVDGPFKHFEGYWHFRPLTGGSSEIELQLSYQFSNPLKRAILQPLFAGIAEQMVRAFVQRAQSSASLPDRHG